MTAPSILLVDDAPELGLVLRSVGRRAGWHVEQRLDAAGAWEYLQTRTPDLVLLDVNLPGESGPDLCRRLRADARWTTLRVALFTLPTLVEDVAAGTAAGADCLVSKDLAANPEALRQRIAEVLADRARSTGTAETDDRPPET
jgi:two-component system phosphate regulon response regulator PhoB